MKPFIYLLLLVHVTCFGQSPTFVLNQEGHVGRIQKILPTLDRKAFITFGSDKSIGFWDVREGRFLQKKWLDIGQGDNGRFIDVDRGTRTGLVALARINSEGRPVVNLIDLQSDRVVGTFEGFTYDLGFVRIDPQERFILTGAAGTGNSIAEPLRLWKIPALQAEAFKVNRWTAELSRHTAHDATLERDGNRLFMMTAYGEDIIVDIVHDPSALPDYTFRKRNPPTKHLGHMALARTSNRVLSVGHTGEVNFFDAVSGSTETILNVRKGWGTDTGDSTSQEVTVNPSGTFAVVAGNVHDRPNDFVEFFDLTQKKKVGSKSGWNQAIKFVSDSVFASETGNGFSLYNVFTMEQKLISRPRAMVQDAILFGPDHTVVFDSSRQSFNFDIQELKNVESIGTGYAGAKSNYHGQKLAIHPSTYTLTIDNVAHSFFPFGMSVNAFSFLNDGRVVAGRTGYRTYGYFLLSYNLNRRISKWELEPIDAFDGPLGSIISIAPSPNEESSLFAARDRLGAITLIDANGPSTPAYKNLLRYWPFVNLNLDVKKGTEAFASPKSGYQGSLKKGDKLIAINGVGVDNNVAIIRLLEASNAAAPVNLEVQRGGQKLQSVEKLNTVNWHQPLLSFVPLDNQEWLCWTPQGYYATSASGERWGGWVINKGVNHFSEFHPIYDFKKQFYKPDLLKLVAKHQSFEAAVRTYNETAVQPLSFTSGLNEKLPPTIGWVSPARDTTVSKSTVRFVAVVQSSSKLQSAKVLLNGRTILRRDQLTIRQERDAPEYTVSFDLDLVATENVINLFVENEFGTTISRERSLRMTATETGIEKYKPNLYFVGVGVSHHSIPAYSLSFADRDAISMSEVYQSQKGLLFKNVFTRTLTNENATRTNILEAFYWLEQNATQKDVVVIFIASHGINDKDKFYILPYDGDPDRIRITGVDWTNFGDVLGNLPSKVLLFVDACHSGKLGANLLAKRGNTDLVEAVRALATEENGVVIMAASTGKESSLESPEWQHGAFTLALIEGMGDGKADINGDHVINIREIDYYVAERVRELTNGRQHPTTQKPSVVSEFPLVMKREGDR